MSDLKKPCYNDSLYPSCCYEDEVKKGYIDKHWCKVLLHGGTWEDCRFGKDWKEPGPPAFEGD